ncbi:MULTISPECIES: hypothetical protein [Ralstonia]|uniref:hypothetical protein n=1 Tax=Ralstonia TaxID=48736 RepID=UPI00292E04B8|nr:MULTISPECIES: hypothetical protein [Ralstonia]
MASITAHSAFLLFALMLIMNSMVGGWESPETMKSAGQLVAPTSCLDRERAMSCQLLVALRGTQENAMEPIMNRESQKDAGEINAYLRQFDREQLLELGAKLYEMAKKQCQTGFDDRGQPVTQEHFRTLNEMRKILNDRGAS